MNTAAIILFAFFVTMEAITKRYAFRVQNRILEILDEGPRSLQQMKSQLIEEEWILDSDIEFLTDSLIELIRRHTVDVSVSGSTYLYSRITE